MAVFSMTSDERLKSIWCALFSRRGGSGETTRLWDHWDDDTRAAALGSAILEGGELPVVMVRSHAGGWILLTTRRLVCDSGAAPLQEIVSIKPVEFTHKRK